MNKVALVDFPCGNKRIKAGDPVDGLTRQELRLFEALGKIGDAPVVQAEPEKVGDVEKPVKKGKYATKEMKAE